MQTACKQTRHFGPIQEIHDAMSLHNLYMYMSKEAELMRMTTYEEGLLIRDKLGQDQPDY